jgi:acetate kinase
MRVLVVNAGSSSLKLRLLDESDRLAGTLDLGGWAGAGAADRIGEAVDSFGRIDAVGHRVVHGGPDFTGPVRIDAAARRRIAELADLAPLHQPRALAGIDAAAQAVPGVPAVACFDTAFHAGLPAAAATYPVPEQWRRRWSLRRYGFHGLSHAYAARRAAELAGSGLAGSGPDGTGPDGTGPDGTGLTGNGLAGTGPERLRTVTCHLGAGASLAAVSGGASVDTTMGFTPLEGLVMATRSGTVDPGMLLWLLDRGRLDRAEVADALEHRSGLAALAGGTGDMREVAQAADQGRPDAELALAVYLHRLRAHIAAMAAAMGGLDTLVFTGGVGEHQPVVRAGAADGLGFLGVRIDAGRNRGAEPDAELTAAGAPVRTFVIAAREDLEIARQVRTLLGDGGR